VDERTRRFDHGQSAGAGSRQGPFGRTVSCHHHGLRRDVGDILRHCDALRLEDTEDSGVVNEVTEDGQGTGVCLLERERHGIAHAETHAEVSGPDDSHTL
jgi:hypothetical protein